MNIDLCVNDWNSIFKILARPIPNHIENHLAINMIIVTLWTLYVMYKKLTDLNKKGIITDELIDFWPTKVKAKLEYEMTLLSLTLPSLQHHLSIKKFDIRQQLLHPQDYFDCHDLNDYQTISYNNWWTKTNLVRIANKALKFSPFRREPP